MDQKLEDVLHRVYGLCVVGLNEDCPKKLGAICRALAPDVRQLFFRKLVSTRTCEAVRDSAEGVLDPELKSRFERLAEMCMWHELDECEEIVQLIEELCPSRLEPRLVIVT